MEPTTPLPPVSPQTPTASVNPPAGGLPSVPAPHVQLHSWFQNHPQKKNITYVLIGAVILIAAVLITPHFQSLSFFVPRTNYVQVYTLVNDKISQHGAIVVNLPAGTAKEGSEQLISFSPKIEGTWQRSDLQSAVVYKASSELTLGAHYQVALATDKGTIKKDFIVDEDPRVANIFPSGNAEADSNTAITIIFNRPMVPLTTLSELESKDIPISITPVTPGKFKWISTRTLQFTPTTTLIPSAHYTVAVNPGFVSEDGLSVNQFSSTFTTKQLRLDHSTSGDISYSDPINFYFNEPVDLDKTLPEITALGQSKGAATLATALVATYGEKTIYDGSGNPQKVQDKSIISIYPAQTVRGHPNVWEFDSQYSVTIQTAYSIGGDIPLTGPVSATVATSPVIKDVVVESSSTPLASPALFDPTGTTTFTFYEDIDVGKSAIHAKGLTNISYGEKCQKADGEDGSYSTGPCTKVEDRSQLIMHFDASVFAHGEHVPVTFERLVNAGGYQINAAPIVSELVVFPDLIITSTIPAAGNGAASVSEITFCTNSPLAQYDAKTFYANVHANNYLVFGRWENPYLSDGKSYGGPPPCTIGEYVNKIHYGILPQQSYTISFALVDVFGQKINQTLSFHSGDAPSFYLRFQGLQKMYDVTTPDHTKFTFETENFDYAQATICKVDPGAMARMLARSPGEISTSDSDASSCISRASDVIQLPKAQWMNHYFQIDLKKYFPDPRGQFVISFTHPQYKNSNGVQEYFHVYVSVTNLAAVEKHVKWNSYDYLQGTPNLVDMNTRGSVYWISYIHSMLPVGSAQIKVYQSANNDTPATIAKIGTTNSSGIAEFPLIADVAGAVVTSGDDSAIVSTWADTLSSDSWSPAYESEKMYIYTDRPIYRPGQDVFVKGLYRLDFDGDFKIFKDADVNIQITDSKGNQIMTQRVPVTDYGTFNASIKLPSDAPLGSYYIHAGNSGYGNFDVAEYVGAAFEATATSDKDEYTAGDIANITANAKYYFGVPVSGAELSWSLTSQSYYFDRYSDEYFNFGASWYNCYDCGYGDTYLKSGKITLDQAGSAQLHQLLDFNSLFKDGDRASSKIFVLHGTIQDKQGKSVSFQKSFIVHRGEYYLGVKADPSFTAAKQSFALRAKTVDVNGKAVGKGNITIVVNRVEYPSYKRQEVDGGYYARPERTLTPVITKHVSTDYSGNYSEQVSLSDPGEYEIDAMSQDGKGNTISSSGYIYVYGEGTVDVRPTNNATLDLKADQTDLKSGDTAQFIIQNPFPHAKALISLERGHIFSYEVVDIDQSMYKYSFPVLDTYAPNIFASAVLLSPDPQIKYGSIEFNIDKKAKELSIDIASDKTSYLPGEKVGLTITTKDASGRAVPADVSVAVADLSVLALKGNPKKDPLLFFYNGYPLAVTTSANIKNLLEEAEIPTGTKGGDGGNPADLATKKRGEFKDTAYWMADVVTNAQGIVHVSFTLPDNLTRWQIESVGITKDTKLGVKYQEITAQKGVMTVPLVPRFVVPGDELYLGATIFNQTGSTQALDVSLESPTLTLEDNSHVSKTIASGASTAVYFKVKAPIGTTDGVHTFTLSAKNDSYNDTVDLTLPITRNTTYESVATAFSTTAASATESLYLPDGVLTDRGGLTIKTSATLALYLTDALKYMFAYPYGCSEQLASRLSAISIAKRVLSLPNVGTQFTAPEVTFDGKSYSLSDAVTMGLAQLYDNQTPDGGFAYYKGLPTDPYLSIHVLNALLDLKDAGYPVRQDVINRDVNYLYLQTLYANAPGYVSLTDNTDALIFAAYTLSRTSVGSDSYASLLSKVQGRLTTSYLSDAASSETLGYLSLIAARGGFGGMQEKIFSTLLNRVSIDSRGAYVVENSGHVAWSYYETPEKDTALLVKALSASRRAYAETDNLIRWLLSNRASDGSWGSTNTSVSALDALVEYLTWKKETLSHFTLTTTLDSTQIASDTFSAKNILTSIETFLPISKIQTNTMHTLTFTKSDQSSLPNPFYYDLSLKYYLPVQQIAPRDEGIAISREFYSLTDTKNEHPLANAKVGEVVRGVLTIISPKDRHLFSVEDFIPAGFELVDFNLATEDKTATTNVGMDASAPSAPLASRDATSNGGFVQRLAAALGLANDSTTDVTGSPVTFPTLYPDFKELRDDRLFLFAQNVSAGSYTYEYYLRATTPGTFSHLPAVASDMYFPENFGRTAGSTFTVTQ